MRDQLELNDESQVALVTPAALRNDGTEQLMMTGFECISLSCAEYNHQETEVAQRKNCRSYKGIQLTSVERRAE